MSIQQHNKRSKYNQYIWIWPIIIGGIILIGMQFTERNEILQHPSDLQNIGYEKQNNQEQSNQLQKLQDKNVSRSYDQQKQDIEIKQEVTRKKIPTKVRGIYLSGDSVASYETVMKFINLLEETELNSFIIDVKDDNGMMTYQSLIPMVEETGANKNVRIDDVEQLIQQLEGKQIYPIARIVVFKDPNLPRAREELAIKRNNGEIWRDPKGVMWVDPYKQDVWEYTIEIAKEAASLGFREIQFDYVRFPENGRLLDRQASFPDKNDRTKADVINQFLTFAKEELEPYNTYVSADVFGLTTSVNDDMNIGQDWNGIAKIVDYICPMIYPSHYESGNYNLPNPNADPYQTVYRALQDAISKNQKLEEAGISPAIIRPWLQDFSMGGVTYGPNKVVAQIRAAEELGIDEYIMWNAANEYTESVWKELRKKE